MKDQKKLLEINHLSLSQRKIEAIPIDEKSLDYSSMEPKSKQIYFWAGPSLHCNVSSTAKATWSRVYLTIGPFSLEKFQFDPCSFNLTIWKLQLTTNFNAIAPLRSAKMSKENAEKHTQKLCNFS